MSIRPERWLEVLLASPAQVRLLRVLAGDPAKYWTEREAGSAAGLPPSTSHLIFKRLHETGVLEVRRAGRSHLVRLRPDLGIAHRLREIFAMEATTLDDILEAAAEAVPPRVALYLFGSTARGTAKAGSDLDLLIVAPDAETAETAAAEVRSSARRVSPTRIQIVALDRRRARQPRYRRLLATIKHDGRRLSRTTMREAVR